MASGKDEEEVSSASDLDRNRDAANAAATAAAADPRVTVASGVPGVGDASGEAEDFSDVDERKLMVKIDMRLILPLSVMYLLAFLDRTNIGNAAVYGLEDDLGMVAQSNQFNLALTIFFIPYVLFEIPSNVLLKKLKPHLWISACMLGFGLITVVQGLVTSVGGLYATRFLLGLFETGMFPGSFYLLGMWYRRREAQKRFSFFFSSTSLAGAFGGLIAAGINRIDGALGHRAWRWVFIIEGTVTMAVALALYFAIPDFPETAGFLTDRERRLVVARTRADQGTADSGLTARITARDVVATVTDLRVLLGGFMFLGAVAPAYGYAFFAPTIIRTFRLSPLQTQLHSVPPWAASFGWSMVMAYASDRCRHRFAFAAGSLGLAGAGFAVLLAAPDAVGNRARYAALHLVTAGVYGGMPIMVCWYNLNLGGHRRRAIGSAWQVGFGNMGGIIATYAFLAKDSPRFVPGYAICLSFLGLSLVSCILYLLVLVGENAKKRRVVEEGGGGVMLTDEEKQAMGDLSPGYRYMY